MDLPHDNPVLARLYQVLESDYSGLLLFVLIVGLGVLWVLVILRCYRILFLVLLLGQSLSLLGGAGQGVFTLVRFAAIFGLLPLALPGIRNLGWGAILMLLGALYLVLLVPISSVPFWSLQRSAAFAVLIVSVGGAIRAYAIDMERVRRILVVVATAGMIWLGVSVAMGGGGAAERGAGESRFHGAAGKTTSASTVGGLLAPYVLWAAMTAKRRARKYLFYATFVVLMPVLVLIGQRMGLFAAIVGVGPLLFFRMNARRLLVSMFSLAIAAIGVIVGFGMADRTLRAYLLNKYIYNVGYLSGRDVRWQMMLNACLQNPVLGHGSGTTDYHVATVFGSGVHNAYLTMWYDGGAIYLLLWCAIVLRCVVVAVRGLSRRMGSESSRDMLRLLLGSLVAMSAYAFFESGLTSPTNIVITLFLLCVVLIDLLGGEGLEVPTGTSPTPFPQAVVRY